MSSDPALDKVDQLTTLGNNVRYAYDKPTTDILQTFPNRHPEADYFIHMEFPEFTSLCPKTGQPDFASIVIDYVPGEKCLESKSIKLYFFAFRNFGAFMESITNKILRDFVEVCQPRQMKVTGNFAPRGALTIKVEAFYHHKNGFNFKRARKESKNE